MRSNLMRVAVLATVMTMVTASPSVAAPTGDRLKTALDRITAAGMPGAFAEARSPLQRAASGLADLDTQRPVRPHFRHRMGSITKTFTATVVLQLAGEGKIDLDAPVSRYLPQYDTAGVTVRMLLNHTSNLGDYDSVLFSTPEAVVAHRHTTFTPDQLARAGLGAPRTGPAGGPWAYSNTNYVLAGLIIEKVTGRPAGFELTRRIIWPLGLRHTYLAGPSARILGPHANAYIPWYEGELMDFTVYNMSWGWMVGDIVSTTGDINRFFRALLTGELLQPRQLEQMRATVPLDPAQPGGARYGLGIMTIPMPCGQVWGHDGMVFGHMAISLHTADAARQITLAMNLSHYGAYPPLDEAIGQTLFESLCPATGPAARHSWTWQGPTGTPGVSPRG